MLSFFKKSKKVFGEIKAAFEPAVDTQAIIAEIHESFDSASEKLLNEAKEIISGSYDIEKGERLKNIGFVKAKKAVEATTVIQQKKISSELAALIEYYQINYPNNKFITDDMVKSICSKYGLLFGETQFYISDVPEKNLSEIENFKLKEIDMTSYPCYWMKYDGNGYYIACTESEGRWGYRKLERWGYSFNTASKDNIYHYEAPPLMICASVKDFDLKEMRIKDGYKLQQNLPDPIVLQPVKGGYLIVSKWGIEASDELVVNTINN